MENIEIKDFKDLQCGENIYQSACVAPVEGGVDYDILTENKDLEYIDILNFSKAVTILAEFFDVNASVVVKDSFVCSAALGSSEEVAFEKVLEADSLAVYGGTVGFTKEVSLELAKQLKSMKVKNILSTSYSKEAVDYLSKSADINVVRINSPLQEIIGFTAKDIKVTPFGILAQEQNLSKLTKNSFKVVTKAKPGQQQAEDAIFAWKIAKHVKSHSAVIVKDLSTKAIVQSGVNGVVAAEKAMDLACENSKDAVLAVDGVIENEEVINAAIQGRIGLIIEAGDSKNSDKILKLAEKYNIVGIHTGIRNYKY